MADEIAENAGEIKENETAQAIQPNQLSDLKPKMKVTGTVKSLELYGAFLDLGIEGNAILHISRLSEKVNRPSDLLSVGDEISVWVEGVDPEREQVTVSMIEPLAVDWSDLKVGQVYSGTVVRLERFGAFIDIGAEKEGLIHVSELSHEYVKHPSEVVKPGDEIEVQVLGFSKRKRRIDLSRKALIEDPELAQEAAIEEDYEEEIEDNLPTAMEIALRRAMGKTDNGAEKSPKSKVKARPQGEKKRNKQDDILNRTLKLSQEASSE